jgi:hypothetical protein
VNIGSVKRRLRNSQVFAGRLKQIPTSMLLAKPSAPVSENAREVQRPSPRRCVAVRGHQRLFGQAQVRPAFQQLGRQPGGRRRRHELFDGIAARNRAGIAPDEDRQRVLLLRHELLEGRTELSAWAYSEACLLSSTSEITPPLKRRSNSFNASARDSRVRCDTGAGCRDRAGICSRLTVAETTDSSTPLRASSAAADVGLCSFRQAAHPPKRSISQPAVNWAWNTL